MSKCNIILMAKKNIYVTFLIMSCNRVGLSTIEVMVVLFSGIINSSVTTQLLHLSFCFLFVCLFVLRFVCLLLVVVFCMIFKLFACVFKSSSH